MKHLLTAAFIGLMSSTCYAERNSASPTFAEWPEVQEFIKEMQDRHGFDATLLTRQFASIRSNPAVLRAIQPAAVPELQRSWKNYSARFLTETKRLQGLHFWQQQRAALARAEAEYGVPQEIIVAIIGVETGHGRNTGKFRAFDALSTLAFDYPPRASFFRGELEQLLLMARENKLSPLDYKGSYAGAMGIPQFMPSSWRNFAVDFDGDGRIDLRRSAIDAIGSVASFLKAHGWQPGGSIAIPASADENAAALAPEGEKSWRPLRELREHGVLPLVNTERLEEASAMLIDLVSPERPTEYWLGFNNFYVITRYNRSSFYAMSVFLLAQSLREAHDKNE
jgi:membrane-bound lytic murein transglycosylase B